MRKLLIILTRKYPYAFGEPFLESEINKHNPYYDKIMVLAQDVSKREVMTRALPENRSLYYCNRKQKKHALERLVCLIFTFIKTGFV